jgi:hypothetical protein
MKIGIITIATGKYSMYIQELVETSEDLFLCGHDRKYFVYTDCDIEQLGNFKGSEKIIKIHQDKLGWPYDSMMRFHMFDENKELLGEMDYLFFMNANMKIVDVVDESILPKDNKCGITSTVHPGYYRNKNAHNYPYERGHKSEFYVRPDSGTLYYQGCFNGGRTAEFLYMSELLRSKMDIDINNGIIPIWHDESALNWYLIDKDPLALPPTYAYPENCDGNEVKKALYEKNEGEDISRLTPDIEAANLSNLIGDPFEYLVREISNPKIIQRNKNMQGGKIYLRK